MKKQPKNQPRNSVSVRLRDMKPKKETKAGASDSFYGTGIYKSTDSGRTWTL